MRKLLPIILFIISVPIILLILIFCILVLSKYFMHDNTALVNLSNSGQFLSGTVGILVSVLVGIFVLGAFIEQRNQISLSELSNQIQSFENGFFQLLNLYEESITELDVSEAHIGEPRFEPEMYKGRKVFRRLYDVFYFNYQINSLNQDYFYGNDATEPVTETKKRKLLSLINYSYLELDAKYQPYIGYYFRNIYYIIVLINSSEFLSLRKKQFYMNILRSKISGFELILLFYNCLSERGNTQFKKLIESYNFMEHINVVDNLLIDRENVDHKYLYNKSAFGG